LPASYGFRMDARTPEEYLAQLDEPRRGEIKALHDLISEALPDLEPHIASGMLAYGTFHYRYASGREGDSSLVSLASRKQYISIYVFCSVEGQYLAERYVDRLPKASIGKSCVRFRRNADVDLDVVCELIAEAGSIGPPAPAN
jgi:hypothetical protein